MKHILLSIFSTPTPSHLQLALLIFCSYFFSFIVKACKVNKYFQHIGRNEQKSAIKTTPVAYVVFYHTNCLSVIGGKPKIS